MVLGTRPSHHDYDLPSSWVSEQGEFAYAPPSMNLSDRDRLILYNLDVVNHQNREILQYHREARMEVGDAAKGKDPDYGARNRGVSSSTYAPPKAQDQSSGLNSTVEARNHSQTSGWTVKDATSQEAKRSYSSEYPDTTHTSSNYIDTQQVMKPLRHFTGLVFATFKHKEAIAWSQQELYELRAWKIPESTRVALYQYSGRAIIFEVSIIDINVVSETFTARYRYEVEVPANTNGNQSHTRWLWGFVEEDCSLDFDTMFRAAKLSNSRSASRQSREKRESVYMAANTKRKSPSAGSGTRYSLQEPLLAKRQSQSLESVISRSPSIAVSSQLRPDPFRTEKSNANQPRSKHPLEATEDTSSATKRPKHIFEANTVASPKALPLQPFKLQSVKKFVNGKEVNPGPFYFNLEVLKGAKYGTRVTLRGAALNNVMLDVAATDIQRTIFAGGSVEFRVDSLDCGQGSSRGPECWTFHCREEERGAFIAMLDEAQARKSKASARVK